jgi:biopolymer transport protein ExbB
MKRTFLILSALSLLTSAFPLHSNETLAGEEIEQMDMLSTESEDNLEDELLSLEEDILSSEEQMDVSGKTPELLPISEATVPSSESVPSPLFSALEENSPLELIEEEPMSEPSSLPFTKDVEASKTSLEDDLSLEDEASNLASSEETPSSTGIEISLLQVVSGAPLIYSILLGLSLSAIAIWLYSMVRLKSDTKLPTSFAKEIRNKLLGNDFQEAANLCETQKNLFSQIIAAGLSCRKHGLQAMLETMKAEGKKATISSWQRLSLLQDIIMIAPMLGLLGTVLGLFYAFYDLNRSLESMTNLFDGFGVSVGTTVAGIAVAILSMILYSIAKFRLVQSLARVESEATSLARLMDKQQ